MGSAHGGQDLGGPLPILARAPALRALQPHHGGRVLGKAERSVGHRVMLLAGAGNVIKLSR